MPLSRPRANSLQLSLDGTTKWYPPRPPTPRRSTYPQPGTTWFSLGSGTDADIPTVPPLSYWEPETPSPISPWNPFLSPPPMPSPSSLVPLASPLLPASPLSVFDTLVSSTFLLPRSPSILGPELSPRFLNPRTPPLPPTQGTETAGLQTTRRHSTMCSVPHAGLDKMKYQILYDMVVAVRDRVLEEMDKKQEVGIKAGEKEAAGTNGGFKRGLSKAKKRKEMKHILRQKNFELPKHVSVEG